MPKKIWIMGFLSLFSASAHGADLHTGKALVLYGNKNGATACIECHGANGAGNAAAVFPRLAGMNADYLAKQIHDYRNGKRSDPVMQPIAKALSDAEIGEVVAYFAAQRVTTATVVDDKALWAQGERIALTGFWDHDVPACISCHGPGGRGVGVHFPKLAGQHASYISKQLKAWRVGTRANDPQTLMKGIAQRLPENEVAAVAAYLASLPPAK